MKRIKGNRSGFTLLEVIVAMAMLALIAVPAIGLATMAVSRSKEQLIAGDASDLKTKIDMALRAYERSSGNSVFSSGFVPAGSALTFFASQDLQYIEFENGSVDQVFADNNDEYYKVLVKEPEGYSYTSTDGYRIVLYEVTWPNNSTENIRGQLFFTSVFRK